MGISEDLGSQGLSVQDAYLSLDATRALKDCLNERRARGEFSAARIGRNETLRNNAEVRGDLTCWWVEPLFQAERDLLANFEALRLQLNRDLYLGLFELELHYAWYAPGTGYQRHVDQAVSSTARRLSLILYLNEEWPADAGGELELYHAHGASKVEPVAGRLVCFLAAGREHAVLPARQERMSVSGWYRGL